MGNIYNSAGVVQRTSGENTQKDVLNVLIDEIPAHNTRFKRILLFMHTIPSSINIFDAVVWRMDSDTIDIAQYGQNLSCCILYTAEWSFHVRNDNVLDIRRKIPC